MYLTEKFIQMHPPGTRVRHPFHGAARIVEAHPSHLIVEWDSPMARIEQSNRIDAGEVPYMSRIVTEMISPQQARLNFKQKAYNADHERALSVNQAVTNLERIIDEAIQNTFKYQSSSGSSSHMDAVTSGDGQTTGDNLTVSIPILWTTQQDQTIISLQGHELMKVSYYEIDEIQAALKQYYKGHGWDIIIDQTGIKLSHYQANESVKVTQKMGKLLRFPTPEKLRESVNNRTLRFNETPKG